ncbi:MAG: NAD-dependent epimerase/dehydratase family protein [Anaerolineales bacterium]|nr:NAD-dependent epimerase/dehydratase family protein [Anaerolineales bacterium]
MRLKPIKILITGGAGFIGSWLARACLQAGQRVVVADNLARGQRQQLPEKVTFYEVDICDLAALRQVVLRERPDILSHHAALVFVRESQCLPADYSKVNLDGTRNVLKAAREAGVRKVIFASSGGAVYGDPPSLPLRENAPRLPLSPYGETKMWAEDVLLAEGDGLEVVILRYGNVYGPGQDHSVVTRFAAALRDGKHPMIFGNGSQSRDYVYITDVTRANLLALQPGLAGIYNIGSAEGRSVHEVYQSVVANMNNGISPVYLADNSYEVRHNVLDIRRARSILDWAPEVGFEEGVRLTVQHVLEAT